MPAATLSHSLAIIDRLLMLKRWIGGSIVCVTLFTVALPTVAMQCDHICTQPESAAALKDLSAVGAQSWERLHRQFKRYGHCDDGAVAEAFSETVIKLLGDQWRRLPELIRLSRSDFTFNIFVIGHIDATLGDGDLTKVAEYSRSSCPPNAGDICRVIASAAERALGTVHWPSRFTQMSRLTALRVWARRRHEVRSLGRVLADMQCIS